MGSIILGGLIGLIGGIILYSTPRNRLWGTDESILLITVPLGVTCGILFYVSSASSIALDFAVEKSETYKLAAISETGDYIDISSLSVCYVTDDALDGKRIESIGIKHAYIHEGDYEPAVVIHKYDLSEVASFFLLDWKVSSMDYADFYVPEGTIITEMKYEHTGR